MSIPTLKVVVAAGGAKKVIVETRHVMVTKKLNVKLGIAGKSVSETVISTF